MIREKANKNTHNYTGTIVQLIKLKKKKKRCFRMSWIKLLRWEGSSYEDTMQSWAYYFQEWTGHGRIPWISSLPESESESRQSHLTLCDSMHCSPLGSSVHGILQARILACVPVPFSRGSSQPRDQTQVCSIAGGFFAVWATREAP